jgi:tRNA-specific 2-thiouridylase
MQVKNKKIFVGMSGGVDSSVSAMLLKQQGYDVVGVFIKTWQPDYIECTWKEERLDAIRIAAQLDIPFITLDAEREYKKGVIDYMINEYASNRTPNPDVMCNREVKFGAFLKFARESGADYVATGHYAQNINNQLYAGLDHDKDQSYFLSQIKKEDLFFIKFPIGHLRKSQVRDIARKNSLYVSDKKDSQGLCFVGQIDIKDFLKREIKTKSGDVVDDQGNVIGQHDGVQIYTLGERHGFAIFKKESDKDLPYYVIDKNPDNNTLKVSHDKSILNRDSPKIKLKNINYFVSIEDISKCKLLARSRYREELFEVLFDPESLTINTKNKNTIFTSGQILAVYDNKNRVLFSAEIE